MTNLESFDDDISSCYGTDINKNEKNQMVKLILNTTYGVAALKNYALGDLEIYTTLESLINGGHYFNHPTITDDSSFYLHDQEFFPPSTNS
jgi:hypothetical protein